MRWAYAEQQPGMFPGLPADVRAPDSEEPPWVSVRLKVAGVTGSPPEIGVVEPKRMEQVSGQLGAAGFPDLLPTAMVAESSPAWRLGDREH